MKKFLTIVGCILIVVLCLCSPAHADADSLSQQLPFPVKGVKPTDFSFTQDGALMIKSGSSHLILDNGKWKSGSAEPYQGDVQTIQPDPDYPNWIVSKDGEVIFSTSALYFCNSFYAVDEHTAYATRENKLYIVDMTTGSMTAIAYIEGYSASSWANGLLVFGSKAYIMQTDARKLCVIDLDGVKARGYQSLSIAVSSDMDIGNVVLASTEERFAAEHLNTIVDIQRMTADQLRLALMSNPAAFDLIVCEPLLWNDLAKAGIFENLEAHAALADAWQLWTDMSLLCRQDGVLLGVPLWDNCPVLQVNDQLLSLLNDAQWPEANWTWADFLALARACARDLDGNGTNDTFITYQRIIDSGDTYSLPVHQVASLWLSGQITDARSQEVLDMLTVWKTCWNEGLIYPAASSYVEPHITQVVLPWAFNASWPENIAYTDIRLTYPGLSETLRCSPAKSILMSMNHYGQSMEQAVDFMEIFMRYGADEHDVLKTHDYFENEYLPQVLWAATPGEFHASHFVTALESACRDPWDMSLYDDMEQQLDRFLAGQISAEECAQRWQDKLRMTQME